MGEIGTNYYGRGTRTSYWVPGATRKPNRIHNREEWGNPVKGKMTDFQINVLIYGASHDLSIDIVIEILPLINSVHSSDIRPYDFTTSHIPARIVIEITLL